MKYNTSKPAVLLLEDGTSFKGKAIGKIGISGGEICFNTGMTGYQEIYSDPSYYGQIIVNTASHIGNYGASNDEQESGNPQIKGLVVNNFSHKFSRATADEGLQEYLERNNTVGITDIDTRKVVRHIRDKGAMNAIISSDILDIDQLMKELANVPSMESLELSSKVTTHEPYLHGDDKAKVKIAVLDLGVKASILKNLTERGAVCKVFPAKTNYEEMNKWSPDGYFISNGPGDPAAMQYAVDTVKNILDADLPVFGICLGHQIIARACGIDTYKMHHGHRGINHPVKNLFSGKSEITSQNHGFSVDIQGVLNSDKVTLTHTNLNDETVEGISINGKRAFSVQYHPESSPGPHDSRYLFDQFLQLITN